LSVHHTGEEIMTIEHWRDLVDVLEAHGNRPPNRQARDALNKAIEAASSGLLSRRGDSLGWAAHQPKPSPMSQPGGGIRYAGNRCDAPAGNFPVTNIRNTTSPHWRGWMKPENRCLVPANSFAEYTPEPNPATARRMLCGSV
jgi:putative SOS response-associated peptidase YedK